MDEGVVEIILRYNGYWKDIPRTNRKKYECGNQKTLRIEVTKALLKNFGEQVAQFLPHVRGHIMKLHYTIPGTNPRKFGVIKTNGIFMGVFKSHLKRRLELFLSLDSVDRVSLLSPVSYRRRNPPREGANLVKKVTHVNLGDESSDDENMGVNDDRFVHLAENNQGAYADEFEWDMGHWGSTEDPLFEEGDMSDATEGGGKF